MTGPIRGQARLAFTLIELLVVMAVIGVLAGLLFPAVQSIRSQARSTSCLNNLRQIGFGITNYATTRKHFPPSGWTVAGPGNPAGAYMGWRAIILPYLEQENLHTIYDKSIDWWQGANLAAASYPIDIYLCPSSPTREPVMSAIAKPPRPALSLTTPLASTDYEVVMGVNVANINAHLPTPLYNSQNRLGVMYRNSSTRYNEIRDGLTATILVVECAGRPEVYRQNILRSDLSNDQGIGWADSEGPFSLDCSNLDGSVEGGGPAAGSIYVMNRRNDNEPYSFHSGGMNVTLVDGGTRYINEEIDVRTFASLITANAGEIVTGDSF